MTMLMMVRRSCRLALVVLRILAVSADGSFFASNSSSLSSSVGSGKSNLLRSYLSPTTTSQRLLPPRPALPLPSAISSVEPARQLGVTTPTGSVGYAVLIKIASGVTTNILNQVDLQSGNFIEIGIIADGSGNEIDDAVQGLKFNPCDNQLYALAGRKLYTINRFTAIASLVSGVSGVGTVTSLFLTLDPSDCTQQQFYTNQGSARQNLVSFNTTDFQAVKVGDLVPLSDGGDIDCET